MRFDDMMYIVCYDITENRLRTKIMKKLMQLGLIRLQYSVFVGEMSGPLKLSLELWLKQKNFQADDSIAIIPISKNLLEKRTTLGKETEELATLINQPNTLFF